MVSKTQKKSKSSNQLNAFHSIITNGNLYDLGYGIYEIIMVLGMVSKTPYLILEMVTKMSNTATK